MVLLFWRDLLLHCVAPGSSPSFQDKKGNLGSNSSAFEQSLGLHPAAKPQAPSRWKTPAKSLTKSSSPNLFVLTTNCPIFLTRQQTPWHGTFGWDFMLWKSGIRKFWFPQQPQVAIILALEISRTKRIFAFCSPLFSAQQRICLCASKLIYFSFAVFVALFTP